MDNMTHVLGAVELENVREELGLATLEVITSDEWSSDMPTYRQKIREHLLTLSTNELEHNKEALSNLGEIPDLSKLSMSISHCKGLGGYALTEKPFQIGFDLEETSRMNAQVVRRVCEDPSEIEKAPSPAHLWVAKESSFKALLGAHQPPVIGDIEVLEWAPFSFENSFSFKAKPLENVLTLNGVSFEFDDYHVAVACLKLE